MSKSEHNLIEANTELLKLNKELLNDIKILLKYINEDWKNEEEYLNLVINVRELTQYYNNKTNLNRK